MYEFDKRQPTGFSQLMSAIHPTQPFAAAPMNDRFGETVPLA
jgi:hypothetical protein